MKDLKIDEKGIVFKNGDWILVGGVERIIQNIRVALRTFINEWLLDYRKGINYPDKLKALDDDGLQAQIKTAVREVRGVERIRRFSFNREKTVIFIDIAVVIDGDEYPVSESVSYGGS